MAVKWGETLKKSLAFCVTPKRWLPFFLLDAVFITLLTFFVFYNLGPMGEAMLAVMSNPMGIFLYPGMIIGFLGLLIAWNLLKLWATGAVIHQSYKGKDKVTKSFNLSLNRYPSLLAALIILTALSWVASQLPYVGIVLTVIVALVLFFTYQGIMVKGMGFTRAIKNSWAMMRKDPVKVFIMWLIISLITVAIVGLAAIPVTALIMPGLMASGAASPGMTAAVIASLLNNIPTLVAAMVIFLAGSALATTFNLKATTEFYLQLKKRLPFI